MGRLFFRCPKTGKDFDSGFEAGLADMNALPPGAKLKVRCEACGEHHEFRFADGTLNDQTACRR